jgi:hypothetical protein
MSNFKIRNMNDGEVTETMIANPEHVKVLVNVGEVVADGRVFSDVIEVTYDG